MSGEECPCGSGKGFDLCCEPYLAGKALPETAEALMRSRYSAYVRQLIPYLKETLWPKYQPSFDAQGTARWAAESHWTGPQCVGHRQGRACRQGRHRSFRGKIPVRRQASRAPRTEPFPQEKRSLVLCGGRAGIGRLAVFIFDFEKKSSGPCDWRREQGPDQICR